jgi:hypothetical protein
MTNPIPNGGDPASDGFPSGPEIGQPVPQFSLPDQNGQTVTYHPASKHQSLILFHRSADW